MYVKTKISSYEEFQSLIFADRGRAPSPVEAALLEDPILEPAQPLAHPAPRRRAPLPRWRPPALASNTQVVESLELQAVNVFRSVS